MWLEDPAGDEADEAWSSGGAHAADFLLPPLPGASDLPGKVMKMSAELFVTAFRARLRVEYPAYLPLEA